MQNTTKIFRIVDKSNFNNNFNKFINYNSLHAQQEMTQDEIHI